MLYNSQRRTYRNAAYPSKGGTTTVTATHNQLLVGERWFNGLTALPVVITPGLDKFDDSTVTSDKEWKSPARMLGRLSGVPRSELQPIAKVRRALQTSPVGQALAPHANKWHFPFSPRHDFSFPRFS
jgi:hypothetical protein